MCLQQIRGYYHGNFYQSFTWAWNFSAFGTFSECKEAAFSGRLSFFNIAVWR